MDSIVAKIEFAGQLLLDTFNFSEDLASIAMNFDTIFPKSACKQGKKGEFMYKKLVAATFGMALALALPNPARAETVLEKVARTGVLTLGTHLDLIPYVYVDDQQNVVGYSMDVVDRIRTELETTLGRDVRLDIIELKTEAEHINAIETRQIDIACASRFTWERDRYVDFSVSYSLSGIRLLSKLGSGLGSPESLIDKRIGVVPNSLGAQAMQLVQPEATLVSLKDRESALNALESGEIDAIAGDTILLAGLLLPKDPGQYQLSPTEPYARYGIACMVPEDNSGFLDTVNYAIVKLMEGYVTGEEESVETVDRWLGEDGVVSTSPLIIRSFFDTIIITREQIPLDDD
ncbi:MAG: extracellular substrate binding-like orphan protein GrrP [Spirulina sp.]